MSVIISYKGTPISNLTATSQARLETAGTYCDGDVTVGYTAPATEITCTYGTNLFKGVTGLTSITDRSTASTLGDSCFYQCTGLTDVSGFPSVTTLTQNAFYGCTNLTSVSGFPSLTTIGQYAFKNCSALTTLPTEPTITSIGAQAFYGCTSLVKFDVPTNVTSLTNQIFYNCSSLIEIVIHGTVNNFQPGAANNALTVNCTNLEKVTLPGGSYGSYVLYNNKKITDITIGGPGNPVTSINNNAFYGCNGVPCDFVVYTVDAEEISHNASNYWGNNKSETTCTFKDSNGIKPDHTIGF